MALALAVSVLAAHRVVLNRTRLSRATFRYLLIGLAVPVQALMIPVFVVIDNAHLYDTLAALILTGVAFSIPVSVLILVNFLREVRPSSPRPCGSTGPPTARCCSAWCSRCLNRR